MTITEAVILRINNLLKEQGMTKKQLAIKANISQGTLSSIYKKIAKGVSLSTLFCIAHGFGMTASEFLSDAVFENIVVDGMKIRAI